MATFGLETGKEKASLQRDRRMNEKCREKRGQRVLLVPKNFLHSVWVLSHGLE